MLLIVFAIPSFAGTLHNPQKLDGLQVAIITYSIGDTNIYQDARIEQSEIEVISSTAYTQAIDIADIIASQGIGEQKKVTLRFYWSDPYVINFNELCFKGINGNFKITISATGTSSFNGDTYTAGFSYVNQAEGWFRYDNYSYSSTKIPLLSSVKSLYITLDGGSNTLSLLEDMNFYLSLSMLPYNINQASDLQYNLGYQDATNVYKDIVRVEQKKYYDRGKLAGFNEATQIANDQLIPEAYANGKRDGFTEGKEEGLSIAQSSDLKQLVFAVPDAFLTSLSGFLNWELLGFNLYKLLGGVFLLIIVGFILKFCLRTFL